MLLSQPLLPPTTQLLTQKLAGLAQGTEQGLPDGSQPVIHLGVAEVLVFGPDPQRV